VTLSVVVDFGAGVRRKIGYETPPFGGEEPPVPEGVVVSIHPADSRWIPTAFEVEAVEDTPDPPPVTEEFPASGTVDRVLTPSSTQAQIDAIQSGEIVEFMPGNYGDKTLNVLANRTNVYAFCRATIQGNGMFGVRWSGTPAYFQHVHDGACYDHPFANNVGAGVTIRGMRIRGYSAMPTSGTRHHGSGLIRFSGNNCKLWDCEISHTRESAFHRGTGLQAKRLWVHHCGRYVTGAGTGNNTSFRDIWAHDIATSNLDGMGLRPEAETSDKGVCKIVAADSVSWYNIHYWDIGAMGIWWDGAGTNGSVKFAYARNVSRQVVNLEICFGPFLVEDIHAEDCSNASEDGVDVIRSIVCNPLTPDVTVRRVYGLRCGNGVTTHNRYHHVLDDGMTGISPEEMRSRLGVQNLLVEDCDFSDIEGGAGAKANRYNAGWAGGEFTYLGEVIEFRNNRWRNNTYSPNAEFRAGSDYPFGLSRWQNVYGMS
jgi:hypothetical protein